MEKYKIKQFFTDAHTGEAHEKGSIKEFTQERAKEILKAGEYIEKVEQDKPVKPAAKSEKAK